MLGCFKNASKTHSWSLLTPHSPIKELGLQGLQFSENGMTLHLVDKIWESSKVEYLSLNTIDTWDQVSLCCWGWGCPVHGGIFSSIPGGLLGANSTPSGLPRWLSSKESAANAGDTGDAGSIPGSGRSPGGRNGNPLQYSCLGNPMDRGA